MSCLLLPISLPAQAPAAEELDEAFLHFRYRGAVDTLIAGLYDGERVHLPFSELFHHLQIDHAVRPGENVIEGFFLEEQRTYRIDLATRTATFGEKEISFPADGFVATELEIYFLPEFYEALFDLRFTVNLRRLTLAVTTPHTLPVIRERDRARRRGRTDMPDALREHAPLLFNRDRRLLGGGFLDYSWTSRYHAGETSHNYHLFGGGELLGGDLQGAIHGGTLGEEIDFSADDLRWRYVFDPNPVLTQFLAGGLASTGLLGQSYRGIRLTNQPIEPRRLLGFYHLQGKAEPGWDVELYLNNRLVESVQAGPTGDYVFQIPLGYGTQQTTIRLYGPTGEYEEVERRFSVPFLFLPPGEVNYTIDAGRTSHDQRDLLQTFIGAGLTERLTAGVGVDYLETLRGEDVSQPVPYHTLSYRLGDGYIASLENAPDALQRLTLNAFYPNQASWEGQFTRFRSHPFYNPANATSETRGSLFVPFSVNKLPLSFRLRGRILNLEERETEIFYNPELDLRYQRALFSAGIEETRGARTETRLVGGFRYSFAQPDLLKNLILRARYRYDPRRSASEELLVDVSRRVTRNGRIRAGWRHHFPQQADFAEVSFSYDFPVLRSTTTYRSSGGGSVVQNFRGSVAYDSEYNRFIGHQRPMVGTGGAAFRPFVDYEGTGSFDEGDLIIEDRVVQFREPVFAHRDDDDVYRAYNLIPYNRYSIEIDEDRIRNPLWVARTDTFSFVTDPNRFKPIDIPFYVSGIIDGVVLRERDGEMAPVGGLRLLLRQIDGEYEARIPVLSDGSYYQMGLPPGKYEIAVDPIQLERLGASSEPGAREFEVRVTREGDFVEGIDFLLR